MVHKGCCTSQYLYWPTTSCYNLHKLINSMKITLARTRNLKNV